MAGFPGAPRAGSTSGGMRYTGRGRRGRRHHPSDFPFPSIQLPPAGFYDPGLAAQIGQSQRGLLDTEQDIKRANRQARVDTGVQRHLTRRGTRWSISDLQRGLHQGLQDIRYERQGTQINFARDLQDLAVAKQRGEQDYQVALDNLGRKYENLASSQGQRANARGVLGEGGFAAAAASQRASNQAFEQRPLDISHGRMLTDIGLKRGRTAQDYARDIARYGTLAGRQRQEAQIGIHRQRTDLHSQLRDFARNLHRAISSNKIKRSRAIREQGLYALDTASQAYFSAHQAHPGVQFPSLGQLRRGNVNRYGHPR